MLIYKFDNECFVKLEFVNMEHEKLYGRGEGGQGVVNR
jgi:hypothetical protein